MSFSFSYISYKETKSFSKIVTDYVDRNSQLRQFYAHEPDLGGIQAAIAEKRKTPVNRMLLHARLLKQYQDIQLHPKVAENIGRILHENTFTITTAHQPNIFTGHLYFIYKIIHAVKLSDELNKQLKDNYFVPVYYMGSEDADLDELGEVSINGKQYKWETSQSGAVGRMVVDKPLLKMINEIEGQLSVAEYGKEIIDLVKESYIEGSTIERATLLLVNSLFDSYGLVVLLPDDKELKRSFIPVMQNELEKQFSIKAVSSAIEKFPGEYKVQAAGRDINLFYLKDNIRERIEATEAGFKITGTTLSFTPEEMFNELKEHPDRFSPNVILRPVYQEMILPDIAFIGGGGELAYWLELKEVFEKAAVPFPVIILRNSFMIINRKVSERLTALGLSPNDVFKTEAELIMDVVRLHSELQLTLDKEIDEIKAVYAGISALASLANPTLDKHVSALTVQSIKKINEVEKKMIRAEKKRFDAQQRQVIKIRSALFPGGTLQERIDNIMPYYSAWGPSFISSVYQASKGLDQQFTLLIENSV